MNNQLIRRLELEIPALEAFLETLPNPGKNYEIIRQAILNKRKEYVLESGRPYIDKRVEVIIKRMRGEA